MQTKITAPDFLKNLQRHGFAFFTGVPCSLLAGLFSELERQSAVPFIPSVREDAAVGLCAGAYMAGKLPVLLMQNSGLGYCLNAFTSLNLIYKLPVLVVMSWRGYGGKDAPEHIIMGEINPELLAVAQMPYAILEHDNLPQVMETAMTAVRRDEIPFTILVRKGFFDAGH